MAADSVTLASGTVMPALGLGTWMLTRDTEAAVEHALRIGYRMIDTSGDYGTQPAIGRALRDSPIGRDEVFLVTKVEEDEDAYAAARSNLDELGVERVDLLLIHRPPPVGAGESLWEGLIEARRDGLAREIGVSNYTSEQIDRLTGVSGECPAVNQVEWSPFGHSAELLEHAKRSGIVIQAYSPLTRGRRLDDRTLAEIAEARGRTPAQVMLRWSVQVGAVPLPKAARPEHREENLGALDFELDRSAMEILSGLNERYSSLSGLPYV
jgi:diketogulonate reductase-like aldo/keto reductase